MFEAGKDKYFLFLFLIVAGIFAVMAVAFNIARGCFFIGGDSAQYIILAESLAHGHGLRMLNYPGNPVSNLAPLLSVILSPVIFFFGRSLEAMYLVITVFAALSLAAVYKLFRLSIDKISVFWIVALLATSSLFLSCAMNILTDIIFFPLVVLALYFLKLYTDDTKTVTRRGIGCAVFLVLSFLCRYIGAVVFFTAAAAIFFGGRDRRAAAKKVLFLLIFFLPILLLTMFFAGRGAGSFSASVGEQILSLDGYGFHSGTILAHPEFFFARCLDNIVFYLKTGAKLCFSPFAMKTGIIFIDSLFILFALCVAGYGLRRDLTAKNMAPVVFCGVYIFFLIIWPFHEDGRYFLPLAGYLLFYFVSFLRARKIVFANLLLTMIVICNMLFISANYLVSPQSDKVVENFISVNEWMRTGVRSGAIVMSRKPAMTSFYSGHQAVLFPFSGGPDQVWQAVRRNNVKYLVFDQGSNMARYAALIDRYRVKLKFLYAVDATAAFEAL